MLGHDLFAFELTAIALLLNDVVGRSNFWSCDQRFEHDLVELAQFCRSRT